MAIITYTDGAIFQAGQFVTQSFTVDTTQGVFVTPDTPADETVSLAGRYVVPGLINAHTHVTDLVAADQSPALTNMTEAEVTVFAQKNLRDLLLDGVTTIRNVGSFANIDLSLARLEQLGGDYCPVDCWQWSRVDDDWWPWVSGNCPRSGWPGRGAPCDSSVT
ncbi:amidohydrolase family protein [Weissella cibaria]|uniref:amidohydrolase family protein n=1 Tax=Weissella cibaria TaxID=137591 RepID=UPI0020A7D982|nr:amidohydrolase family protein [Weissella cibaria]MCV3318108.1 amidohydrolase family protein [Weissella cibaria]